MILAPLLLSSARPRRPRWNRSAATSRRARRASSPARVTTAASARPPDAKRCSHGASTRARSTASISRGLCVAALVVDDENLDDAPRARRSVVYVPESLTPEQRGALDALARCATDARCSAMCARSRSCRSRSHVGTRRYGAQRAGPIRPRGDSLPDHACCKMPFAVWYDPFVRSSAVSSDTTRPSPSMSLRSTAPGRCRVRTRRSSGRFGARNRRTSARAASVERSTRPRSVRRSVPSATRSGIDPSSATHAPPCVAVPPPCACWPSPPARCRDRSACARGSTTAARARMRTTLTARSESDLDAMLPCPTWIRASAGAAADRPASLEDARARKLGWIPPPPDTLAAVRGQVVDTRTGLPLPGISLTFLSRRPKTAHATTNALGWFQTGVELSSGVVSVMHAPDPANPRFTSRWTIEPHSSSCRPRRCRRDRPTPAEPFTVVLRA